MNQDGDMIGTEALVRWRHPRRGVLPASTGYSSLSYLKRLPLD